MYKEGLLMAGRLVQRWKTKSIFYNFSPAGWELMDRTIDFDDTPSSFTPLTLARGLITKAKKAGIPIKEVREIYKGFDVV